MTTLFREFMCFMYLTSLSSRGAAAAGFDSALPIPAPNFPIF